MTRGLADPRAVGRYEWRAPGFLAVDGERGLGPVVARLALSAASERARTQGVCVTAITNSNHIGMLANYVEWIAAGGQSIIAFSTSEALVHPWGGYTPLIGTNPVSIGVPTEDGPFVVDAGHQHRVDGPYPRQGEIVARRSPPIGRSTPKAIRPPIPTGRRTARCRRSARPRATRSVSLSSCWSPPSRGRALGPDVHGTLDATEVCNKGDLFIVVNGPSAALSAYLDRIRSAPPAPGFERVLIPGERARACKQQRLQSGVPVADTVWSQLLALAGSAPFETVNRRKAAR